MNWTAKTLGDVLILQRGFDLPERERIAGAIPIVSSAGITGNHNIAKVNPLGIVTGRYGTLGAVYLLHEPFWPLNTTLYVRDLRGAIRTGLSTSCARWTFRIKMRQAQFRASIETRCT